VTEPNHNRSSSAPSVDPATQTPISTKPLVSKGTRRVTAIVSVVVVLVVLAVLIGLGYLMYTSYDRAAVAGAVPGTVRLRDIAFIVIAVETLLTMVLVLIIAVLLVVIVVLVYDRVIPILEQLNKSINTVNESIAAVLESVHTVRGTTAFVSDKVVTPVIEVSSYAAGAARIVKGILDLWPKGSKSQPQQGEPAPVVDESSAVDL
jgi:hypothetical protein